MIHIVLYQPEIPPNTGNIARTCAATATPLHLIEPLGFSISDRQVRRAGLDYWELLNLSVHTDWQAFLSARSKQTTLSKLALLSTKGRRLYTDIGEDLADDLYLVFGPETRGLPREILDSCPEDIYRIPMCTDFRSLNLANTVALVLYDQLSRQGFPGLV